MEHIHQGDVYEANVWNFLKKQRLIQSKSF
jgi:hypothetical protein